MSIESGEKQIVVQKWEETERGWGTRPDGFSLHLSIESLTTYVKKYWDTMPDKTPSEYSRPDGTPYGAGVSEETFRKVIESADGIRFYTNDYPGDGGKDGWQPRS